MIDIFKRGLGRVAVAATAVAALFAAQAADAQQRTRITVYTALENDQLAPYKEAFERAHPDVEIAWVRDSTGTITARFLAERENPRADAIWGLALTSILMFEQQNLLAEYSPQGFAALKPSFRDATAPITWHGMDAFAAAICYNSAVARQRNLPPIRTWADLLNPAFRGQIVMPNPASSGTGYLMVAAWIQMFGEDKAWAFMDKLHANIASYSHSGSKPCEQAAAG
ncbi:MAG: extracellular solute-binding protein, partial [Tagaea sp.]